MHIHAFYIKKLIYIVIGSSISDITRNSDKLHTLYIHFISTVLVISKNNMYTFTLIIILLYCVVILQMCIVYV